jgi:hypothetical protein
MAYPVQVFHCVPHGVHSRVRIPVTHRRADVAHQRDADLLGYFGLIHLPVSGVPEIMKPAIDAGLF